MTYTLDCPLTNCAWTFDNFELWLEHVTTLHPELIDTTTFEITVSVSHGS